MVVAGEASGDLHGGGVVRELKQLLPSAEVFGIGGDTMQSAGMTLLHHIREMSFLGFAEVVKHLPFIRKVLKECEESLKAHKPDVLVLVDYPGFNLKLARIAHSHGVPVLYYISPQVWAWHASRVKQMKGVVDKMLVVFPFEVEIYKKEGIPVEFVGHPLLEQIKPIVNIQQTKTDFFTQYGLDQSKPLVALFPGSRKQEIERMLPTFIDAVTLIRKSIDINAVIGSAPTILPEFIEQFLHGHDALLVNSQTPALQRFADVALTKSGTSTLELAIAETPMVVSYKTSGMSYMIGKSLAQIDKIALPNILAGKRIVPEFIQNEATPEHLANAALALLNDAVLRAETKRELAAVRGQLGTPGASKRVAEQIVEYLKD